MGKTTETIKNTKSTFMNQMLLQVLVVYKTGQIFFHKIQGVFQKSRETHCFSRRFPGPWKNIKNCRSFPGNPDVTSNIVYTTNDENLKNIAYAMKRAVISNVSLSSHRNVY